MAWDSGSSVEIFRTSAGNWLALAGARSRPQSTHATTRLALHASIALPLVFTLPYYCHSERSEESAFAVRRPGMTCARERVSCLPQPSSSLCNEKPEETWLAMPLAFELKIEKNTSPCSLNKNARRVAAA